jgi:plasmid stability protein
MANMTIRNLDDSLKTRLRVRAAEHGKSMKEEASEILHASMPHVEKLADFPVLLPII